MGNATATVKGGFWPENGVSSLTGASTTNAQKRRAATALATKGNRALRELAETLNGAAAGSAALKTQGRIEANVELGGKRTIESETLVNRNTTTADRDELNSDVFSLTSKTTFGASPPANRDGNPLGTR
jgi:hypothetical protein